MSIRSRDVIQPLALAVLLLVTSFALVSGQAQTSSTNDCWSPEDGEANSYVEAPLWVGNVTYELLDGSADTFVHERAAFVHPGDHILVEFELENRVPEQCEEIFRQVEDLDEIVVKVSNDLGNEASHWEAPDSPAEGSCGDQLNEPGGTCSVEDVIHIPSDVSSNQERAIRFIAANDDGDQLRGLVGVERVLIVGPGPDLEPVQLEPVDDDQLRTVYGTSNVADINLTLRNEGSYPQWNPNGGADFWGRPATDKTGDNSPDHRAETDEDGWPEDQEAYDTRESRYDKTDPSLPPCIGDDDEERSHPWTSAGSHIDVSQLVCSYRRGAAFPMPVHYEIVDPYVPNLTEKGILSPGLFHATEEDMDDDKDDSLLPGDAARYTVPLIDTNHRAGPTIVDVTLGHDGEDWAPLPDFHQDNNRLEVPVDISGVDLAFSDVSLSIEKDNAELTCGSSPETACPLDASAKLQATITNAGDPSTDTVEEGSIQDPCGESENVEPNPTRCRDWSAGVYVDGELQDQDDKGLNAISNFESVPSTREDTDLWDANLQLNPTEGGGRHRLEVRVDAPDLYDSLGQPYQDFGRVVERTEADTCQEEPDNGNLWCATVYFEDPDPPKIEHQDIETSNGKPADEPEAYEGEDATFKTNVEDRSLDSVFAIFTLPDGSQEFQEMEPNGGGWQVTRNFTGQLGTVYYSVHATDEFGHTTQSPSPLPLNLEPLPKDVDVKTLEINGQDLAQNESPPAYEGSAAEPENWLRVEAEITGTGHEDAWTTEGKAIALEDRHGTEQYNLPMSVYTLCDLVNPLTDEKARSGYDEECEGSQTDGLNVENVRPRFYIDTRCENAPDEERPGCQQAPEEIQSAWDLVSIDWAGTFRVGTLAADVHDRVREHNDTATISVPEAPSFGPIQTSSSSIDPGDLLGLFAQVSHPIKLENVTATVDHPGGNETKHSLTVVENESYDPESNSGTYTTLFSSGASEDLPRAGLHNITLEAEDLAGNTNVSQALSVVLEDQADPVIDTFDSKPSKVQEAGGPLAWEANLEDETEIKSARLTVQKPTTGTVQRELVYNATTDRYESDPIVTNAPDIGNWSYDLTVQDWAGNVANATGHVRIEEDTPPQVREWRPHEEGTDGNAYGSSSSKVKALLVDYGEGVNEDTIEMTVNGEPVEPSLEALEHGYRVTYELPQALDHGEKISASISAEDLSDPPLASGEITHTFTVDAVAPIARLDADGAHSHDGRVHVEPSTELSVLVDDEHSGPGQAKLLLEEDSEQARATKTVSPGETFRIAELSPAYHGHGDYLLTVEPIDQVGNTGSANVHDIFVDDSGPRITLLPPEPDEPDVAVAEIRDDSPLDSVTLLYKSGTEAEQAIPMEEEDGRWRADLPSTSGERAPEVRIHAEDIFGHSTTTPPITHGATPVGLEITQPSPEEQISGVVTVSWELLEDSHDVEDAEFSIAYSSRDGFFTVEGAQAIQGEGSFALDTTRLPDGEITLHVSVSDDGLFGADKVSVSVLNGDELFQDPRLGSYDDGDTLEGDEEVEIAVAVVGEPRAVWANVTRSNGALVEGYELEPGEDGEWKGSLLIPSEGGAYQIDLVAMTEDGYKHSPGAFSFEVQSEASSGSPVRDIAILSGLLAGTLGIGRFALRHRGKP